MIALFPGQGAQVVGMGKELFENFAIAREVFEEANDSVKKRIDKLCFEGPESDLTLTENTQPCIVTVSVAAFRVTEKEYGFKPKAVAGHSLGEYSALVAAGAIPFSSAVRWVHERGKAMQQAVPVGEGAMAAVMGLEDTQVEDLCKKATQAAKEIPSDLSVETIVVPVNYNAPGQVVIAGSKNAVDSALALLKSDSNFSRGKAIPLPVSAPFHSPLMKPARERMAELFSKATPSEKPAKLLCPYIPNRTARMTSEPGVVFELLVEQVDHPVLWKQSMESFLNQGFTHGIEFGPGAVLQGLAKRIAKAAGKECPILGCGNKDQVVALAEGIKKS